MEVTVENIISKNGLGWTKEQKMLFVEDLLMSVNRPGMDKVIDFLSKTDFYTAPASTKFHSNYIGGLLDHSIIVYIMATKFAEVLKECNPSLGDRLKKENIIVSSILHDVCKICMYTPVEKFVTKDETRAPGHQYLKNWTFNINDTFPIGHGEKSVIMLQNLGLTMYPDEMLAIRYHMGFWGEFSNGDMRASHLSAIDMSPLVSLIQTADYSASKLVETTVDLIATAHE